MSNIKEAFSQNIVWVTVLSSVAGFIADVFRPLAPFSQYLFFASLVISCLAAVSYFLVSNLKNKALPILLFSIISVFTTGVMYGLQLTEHNNEDGGFFANNISFIKKLQNSIGLVQENISDIEKNTKEISNNTAEMSKSIKSVDDKMSKIVNGLRNHNGIIKEPETAEDFYHNARFFEINGDYGNARKAYIKYFTFETNKLDPHIRFQQFLKIQEGRAGAKEFYGLMFEDSHGLMSQYTKILLETGKAKTIFLETLVKENPNFSPAYYELARQYSEAILGTQAIFDKKQEKKYINIFLKQYEEGKLAKFFIDKGMLDKQLEHAHKIKIKLDKLSQNIFDNPIQVERSCNNSGFQINISIPDEPSEILYRIDGKGDFISTGYFSGAVYPSSGKKVPKTFISIPSTSKGVEKYIEFKYIDKNARDIEPFKYNWLTKTKSGAKLEPKAECDIKMLKENPNLWMTQEAKRLYDSKYLLYFSNIFSYGDGLDIISYGIDIDTPNKELRKPYNNRSGSSFLSFDKEFHKISIQLNYKDGTKSDIKTFYFK